MRTLKYVPRREGEQVARDLKPIYTAKDAEQAQAELETFDEKWGQRFPVITQAWLTASEHVIPFLSFPEEVRRAIYTTNVNALLLAAVRAPRAFVSSWSVHTRRDVGSLVSRLWAGAQLISAEGRRQGAQVADGRVRRRRASAHAGLATGGGEMPVGLVRGGLCVLGDGAARNRGLGG
ncbi:MAG: transposase [Solirubrobacteraceae bacterium]